MKGRNGEEESEDVNKGVPEVELLHLHAEAAEIPPLEPSGRAQAVAESPGQG